ncbi:MAG: TonB-dependent receptor [Cyclobacteriaceae bacterium]|nr:TonB-dependent receptor [Cyclobacteriaceae bacterium]
MKKSLLQLITMLSKFTLYGGIIQCLFIGVLIAHDGSAQTRKSVKDYSMSIQVESKDLKEVFALIESKTEYNFFYDDRLIKRLGTITVHAENATLADILLEISKQTNLRFRQINEVINVNAITGRNAEIAERIEVVEQTITVTGTVLASDAGNEALPGVNVVIKGTNQGTVTDIQGRYSLEIPASGTVLAFSSVGYISEEVVVGNRSVINITLTADITALDEIVVVGFGTMKKTDIVGSSASANLEAFKEAPNVNLLQSLQGSVPGVSIGQINRPGQENSIEIRGQSTLSGSRAPLIIVDGMIFSGRFSDINPSDVASVEVLKDASSRAIYGSLAANGVILVTTKPGAKGKPTFNYSGFTATSAPSNNARLLGRDDYLEKVRNVEWRNAFTPESGYTERNPNWDFGQSLMNPPLLEGLNNGTDFDWYDAVTRSAYINSHTLSASGGSDRTTFYMSAGYTNDRGFIINDNFRRFTFRLNIDNKITDWLTIGANLASTFSDRSGEAPTMNTLVRTSPLVLPYDEEGNFIVNPVADNNVNVLISPTNDNLQKRNRIVGNFYAVFNVPGVEGLTYRINYGNNTVFARDYGSRIFGAGQTGEAFKFNSLNIEHNLDNIVNYTKQFQKHSLNATFVYGFQTAQFERTAATGQGYEDLTLSYNNLSLAEIQRIESSAWDEALLYQMARLSYNYDERYLLTATLRRDGFSGFSRDNKFAIFPSIGLGWALSEESFFNAPFVDYLKFRASYGENGNRPGRYSSLARVITPENLWYVFGDGGSTSVGRTTTSLANNQLGWEKTVGLNFGLDFTLLNNRISGNFEYYDSYTRDLLWTMIIPQTSGFGNVLTNIGEIRNEGYELLINGTPIKKNDFTWEIAFNYTRNRNKINRLLGEDKDGDGIEDDLIASGLFIGRSIGAIFDYQVDGIWQVDDDRMAGFQPGSYRIVDQNEDGRISIENDRTILGFREPAYQFGVQNTLRYKQFTFRFFINSIQGGRFGYMAANHPTGGFNTPGNATNANWFDFLDLWSPNNPNATFALPWEGSPFQNQAQRYQQRSFVRLQDISLSYNLSNDIASRIGFKNAKIFISGKNLLTFTNWDGWDPETGIGIASGNAFPLMKSYSLGIDLSF